MTIENYNIYCMSELNHYKRGKLSNNSRRNYRENMKMKLHLCRSILGVRAVLGNSGSKLRQYEPRGNIPLYG